MELVGRAEIGLLGGAARHVYGDIPAGEAELGLYSAGAELGRAAARWMESALGQLRRRLKVERADAPHLTGVV